MGMNFKKPLQLICIGLLLAGNFLIASQSKDQVKERRKHWLNMLTAFETSSEESLKDNNKYCKSEAKSTTSSFEIKKREERGEAVESWLTKVDRIINTEHGSNSAGYAESYLASDQVENDGELEDQYDEEFFDRKETSILRIEICPTTGASYVSFGAIARLVDKMIDKNIRKNLEK